MEKMHRYDCRFLEPTDEITGSGLPKESTGKGRKPPFYGYRFGLFGKPPYNQIGTY